MAPCGAGKTTLVQNLSDEQKKEILDGDQLLDDARVKNRNYFWYPTTPEQYQGERSAIVSIFESYLSRGLHVLYSGNPLLMHTDLLVIPDKNERWRRLQKRGKEGGFCPTLERFVEEQDAYENAASKGIPSFYGFLERTEVKLW